MAGTPDGALRAAAARIGVPEDEYRARIASGEKWCLAHKAWHSLDRFGTDRSRGDGRVPSCRESKNARARDTYVAKPRPVPGRSFVPARDGDAKQARQRVNYFVAAGLLPPPNSLPCTDCGHVWSPGERRHEYDHHNGYAAAHHEDVEPVCTTCHHERERRRRLNVEQDEHRVGHPHVGSNDRL